MTDKKINDKLATIEKALQDFTSCKNFLKVENKNNTIDKLLKIAFSLYEEEKDKGGFLRLLFSYDKVKGWATPSVIKKEIVDYFDFCDIDYIFSVNKQKLFIDYEKKNIIDFLTYKEKVKEIEKENSEIEKEKLLKVKLPFTLDKLDKDILQAVIFQCKEKIKSLNKKQK